MIMVKNTYSKIDSKNRIVEITYSDKNSKTAKIIFDFKNNNTEVVGDLYHIIGYNDTKEDKEKYEKHIQVQKWIAQKMLNTYVK